MDRRRRAAAARVFEDFEPDVEWKLAGEEQDVVEISLPGFRKDQVRVQVDNHGVLRATGECPTRGGRWARFMKDLQLPDNCDADGVRARFEGEKLIITLPIVAAAATPSPPLPLPPSPSPSHSPTPSPPPAAAPEPKPSTPLWTPVSVSPPSPAPLPPAEEPPKKEQVQDTSTMIMAGQDDGKDSRPPLPPPPLEKRADEPGAELRGKVDETATGAKRPEKKNQAGALPAVGDAPPTTAIMTPEPTRQLLVNAAAAVAVLVGIIVAVWRTLQS